MSFSPSTVCEKLTEMGYAEYVDAVQDAGRLCTVEEPSAEDAEAVMKSAGVPPKVYHEVKRALKEDAAAARAAAEEAAALLAAGSALDKGGVFDAGHRSAVSHQIRH